jgi:Tfp pilus assembly protein PilO
LYPASTGYSSVSAELGAIAAKSGLQLESRSFQQGEVKGRNLERVEIEAVVTGSYAGVVRFLNGLQHSNNVYAVAGLTAKGDEGPQAARGQVHVSMHIQTYFRTT